MSPSRVRIAVAVKRLAACVCLVIVCGACAPVLAGPLEDCETAYQANDLAASRSAAEAAIAASPDNATAHWMLARVLIDLGNREADKSAREALYTEAESQARRATALKPDDTWGHHYLAASLGRLALTEGGKRKIELSKEVRAEALRAIELDPRNDRSLHILGIWNREVANLSPFLKLVAKVVYGGVPEGASNEKAVDYFQRAMAINPTRLSHRLELGVTYMEMSRPQDAIPLFQSVLDLPASDPNDAEYKAQAAKWLPKAERQAKAKPRDVSR
ncbi:MAG: tetratricopeptide repeat protein [Candidatus Krumholzibacteriia bacterium]